MLKLVDKSIREKLNMKDPAVWIATFMGTGLIKPGPGTWGTLAALPFGVALMWISPALLGLACLILFWPALWASEKVMKTTNEKDPSLIVVDEVIGMWITLLVAQLSVISIVLAFVLFRFFDVVKPWPIYKIDQQGKGAFSIIADDIVAGLFAIICLLGLRYAGFG